VGQEFTGCGAMWWSVLKMETSIQTFKPKQMQSKLKGFDTSLVQIQWQKNSWNIFC